ncbi:transmembrane protein, putative [Medicago truncatula]|uniref:Transmembrane protein, putative n=1 Tax=Medicago truncatula TaxID=3880 RepID=G7KSF1_MEDTR|nr:transmembrane protein, putative [Medicago truncatula]
MEFVLAVILVLVVVGFMGVDGTVPARLMMALFSHVLWLLWFVFGTLIGLYFGCYFFIDPKPSRVDDFPLWLKYPDFDRGFYSKNSRSDEGSRKTRGKERSRKTIKETIKKDLEINELDHNMVYDTIL